MTGNAIARCYGARVTESPAWEWDETLFSGSAAYYARGRLPYPQRMADTLRDTLELDGTGRLLDVGCGPGLLGLLLAGLFAEVVGVDADPEMVAEAERQAELRGLAHTRWLNLRAETLPAGLGTFRVASFGRSFHWMDRPRVAALVREMLEPGGAWVHVSAPIARDADPSDSLPTPAPPRDAISVLVRRYLGPDRRAGQGTLPQGTRSGEEGVMVAAGFQGPQRVPAGGGEVFDRSEDDIVALVFSLSSSAPHLFGDRLEAFEADLRKLLRATSPTGRFSERQRPIELVIWSRE
jgi:SAM-dependent methyltransferase